MAVKLCDICDYALDLWGRCAKCAGMLDEDLKRLRQTQVIWIRCSIHGAHAVGVEQRYWFQWDEVNPRDRRKKDTRHEWRYRCPKCEFAEKSVVECFKDVIELPEQSYAEELGHKMMAWESRKMRRLSPHTERKIE